jgi:hypothetical protein
MAPSVQELPQVVPTEHPEKLAAIVKETPKVKRQIEIEGGKTDASVCPPSFPFLSLHPLIPFSRFLLLTDRSTQPTSPPGTTARNILPSSPSHTSNMAKAQIPHSKIYFHPEARSRN